MKPFKSKLLLLGVSVTVGLSGLLVTSDNNAAFAVTTQEIEDKKSEIKNIQSKKSQVAGEITDAEKEVEELQREQAVLLDEIRRLDIAVAETNEQIIAKQAEIEQKKEEIEVLKGKIADLKERIEARDELIKNRARSLQEGGGAVSYLEVLLGAKDFGDFIGRMSAVAKIVKADKEILRAHEADKQLKEEEEANLTQQKEELEVKLGELETLQAELERQSQEKEVFMEQLKDKEEELEREILSKEEEQAILAKQEQAAKNLLKALEEEKKREEQARQNGGSAGSGTFIKPAAGSYTSGYGARWGTTHFGVDIAKRGTVPIVASATGVVFRSYYSTSYGNVVFLLHDIDGQTYTTVYAHMNSRAVSEGQVVTQGQQIGLMGNTGFSFGQHLHFEIHKGYWNASKSNAVNPRDYIN
ncbi:murein hydrolase activator EnvC family protein [Bacillus sp. SCS-151]|uniref:murein hydrolase activator EnvC family protein n=1 Tax=Nanhaiella sioensis TaxID=3115293 RepID=UPI003979991D